jgi:hypothetical protein
MEEKRIIKKFLHLDLKSFIIIIVKLNELYRKRVKRYDKARIEEFE